MSSHNLNFSTILIEPCCEANITEKGDVIIQVGCFQFAILSD